MSRLVPLVHIVSTRCRAAVDVFRHRPVPAVQDQVTALIVIGVGLRLWAYLANRPMWVDECMLTGNLLNRSFRGLIEPLDMNQAAPLLFLWLEKLAVMLLGSSEYALRLVPFVCATLSVPLFAFVARRVLSPRGAVLALALFAVSPALVHYAAEVKQYSGDVLCALLVLAAFVRRRQVMETESAPIANDGGPSLVVLAVGGAALIWFSHPAVFVLAAAGITLFVCAMLQGNRKRMLALGGVGAAWSVSFGAFYFTALRQTGANNYLDDFWQERFLPLSGEAPGWLIRAFVLLFNRGVGLQIADTPLGIIAGLFFLLGFAVLLGRRDRVLALAVLPIVIAFAASAVHKYPIAGRLLLFTAPLTLLVVGAGLGKVTAWRLAGSADFGRVLPYLPAAFVVVCGITVFQKEEAAGFKYEDMPAVLGHASQNWQDGDGLILSFASRPAYAYYALRTGFAPAPAVVSNTEKPDWNALRDELQAVRQFRRVWLIVSHQKPDSTSFLDWQLRQMGTRVSHFPARDACATLYDLLPD